VRADDELLEAWRAGDLSAGNALFARHFDSLCRFFRNKVSGEIDDLIQRTLLACLEGQRSFRGDASFKTSVTCTAWRATSIAPCRPTKPSCPVLGATIPPPATATSGLATGSHSLPSIAARPIERSG
jgi:hypothetical protein